MGTLNIIRVINVVTWVISDVIRGSDRVVVSSKKGSQSVFTIGLQSHQNVVIIGRQGRTKVMKGSHMSQRIA